MSATGPGSPRAVVRNSAVLGVAKLLERAVGFIVALLVASSLGVAGLGMYATAWAVFGLLSVAGDAGITNYLVREISRDRASTGTYTVHLTVVGVALSAVLMLAAHVAVPHLGYSSELRTSVSIVTLAILPRVLNGIQEAVFVAHGRVGFETLTRLLTSTTYVLVVAWLLARGHGVPALLRALVATEFAVTVLYFVLINRFIVRLRPVFRFSTATRMVREMKAYTASTALAAFFARPEILILSVLATERDVGLYSAAMRITELPLLVPEVLMINVFPVLSGAYGRAEQRFAAWQAAALRAVLGFSLGLAACFIAAADAVVGLLFSEEFQPAAPVLQILAAGLVFGSLNSVLWRSLAARGAQGKNVQVQCLTLTVRLVAGAVLASPLAAIGAAIASVGSTLLHGVLLARAVGRRGAPVSLTRVSLGFAVAAAATGVAVWLLDRWLPGLVAAAIGGLLYAALTLALGAVGREDLALVRPRPSPPPANQP